MREYVRFLKMEGKKLKVGITGANGRIGTVLRKNLQDRYELKLFAFNPPDGAVFVSEPIPQELNPVYADFANSAEVEGKFEGLDVVIHLAALVDVTPYGENWEKMWKSNFDATWSVFRECIRAKVKRFVLSVILIIE